MKNLLSIISLLLFSSISIAQTQQGIVKTRGRMNAQGAVVPGSRLQGATVTIRNAAAQLTGKNGAFAFAVPQKNFALTGVQKQGYMLCDNDILNKEYQYSSNPFVVVMDTPDNAMADQVATERRIRRILQRQLDEKQDELDALLEQQRITQAEHTERLRTLLAQQSKNDDMIADMAKRYATLDFDALDDFQRQVAFFIQNGELIRADSLLNTKGSMEERSAELDRMDAAIKADEEELARRRKAHERSVAMKASALEDFAADCYSRFEICKLQHKNDSAAYWLELRASKDTTNIEWLVSYGEFVGTYIGDYQEELDIMQRAYYSSLSLYENSDSTINCLSNISVCYKKIGRYDEALRYALDVLDLRKTLHGEIPSNHLISDYDNIAVIYHDLRMFEEALSYYNQCIEFIESNNMENILTPMVYNNICLLYLEMNRPDDGWAYLQKAKELGLRVYGETHPDYAIILSSIGGYYLKKREYENALSCFDESLSIYAKCYSEDHPYIAACYNNMSSVYTDVEDFEKAMAYSQKALEILKITYGNIHAQIAVLYSNIAGIYEQQGELTEALTSYEVAANMFKTLFGEDSQGSLNYAVQLKCMASIYDKLNNLGEAEKLYRKAIDIEENIFETPNIYLYRAYEDTEWFYYNHQAFTAAAECFQKCEELALAIFGPESEEYVNNICGVYNSLTTAYMIEQSDEIAGQYSRYMSSHVITATTVPDGAAAQQGMEGKYIVLGINDWTPADPTPIAMIVQQLQGKPKHICFYKDGIISEHCFDGSMGFNVRQACIDENQLKDILAQFNEWKKKNAKH